jgi:hypothetical protein
MHCKHLDFQGLIEPCVAAGGTAVVTLAKSSASVMCNPDFAL